MRLTSRNLLLENNQKRTVNRICCVCRKLQPIAGMTRVVRVGGNFFVQTDKHLNGRGAHICPQCRQSPNLQKSLSRSFKTQISNDLVQNLMQK